VNADDVEPLKQIFAELPRRDRLLEGLVRRGDNSNIGLLTS
jgi:hypothetical protein